MEELQKKIDEKFGECLITISPNQEYQGIRKPLIFVDRDYGEWVTAPFNVITNGNTHPQRAVARRNATNLQKYGHETGKIS